MAITPPTVGDLNWGPELNAVLELLDLNTTNEVGRATAAEASRLSASANLSDLTSASTARTNLGLGTAATHAIGDFDAAGAATAVLGTSMQRAQNLADVANVSTSRSNLGLGGAAVLAVGTTAGTVAAGDDSRITGAAQKASNLSDLGSATTARTNLGLGGAAVLNVGTTTGTVAAGDDARFGAGGSISAANITYDPTTSAGGLLAPWSSYDLQSLGDEINRSILDRDEQNYLITKRDTLYATYALAGAAPQVTIDGTIPGFAPMNASRLVPVGNLGSGTPSGSNFLRGDGAWAAPTATVVRGPEWQVADNLLKATVGGHPNGVFQTNTLSIASTAYLFKFFLPDTTVITNYVFWVNTAATGTVADFYFALFNADATGTLIANSATTDQHALFAAAGSASVALPSAFTKSGAGYVYAMLQTGTATAQPKLATGPGHNIGNIGLANGTNVAPNASNAPIWGTSTNAFSGTSGSKTAPATTGNVIEGGSTLCFHLALS